MMMPMPEELIVLLALCGLAALFLLWVDRAEMHQGGGRWWRIVEDGLGYFLMLAMIAASLIQVTVRYALSDEFTLPWTEEFGRLTLVWAAMWGAAALQRSDDHISMTIVTDLMPPGLQRAVRLFGDVVILIVLAVITWYGWQVARNLDIMSSIALGMPLSVFAYPVPVAGALMIIHTMLLMVRRVRGLPIESAVGSTEVS